MRRIAKVDANQTEIVSTLRKLGFSVLLLHQTGSGCPDLLLAKHYKTGLAEIKDGSKYKSQTRLTHDQEKFHRLWKDKIHIIYSIEDAIKLSEDW